jgi:hypothetical protein
MKIMITNTLTTAATMKKVKIAATIASVKTATVRTDARMTALARTATVKVQRCQRPK